MSSATSTSRRYCNISAVPPMPTRRLLCSGVTMSPEEIEMMCSLPIWPARVALAPTIPREMRAFESYVSKFDPARLGNLRTPTLIMLGGDSPASEKAAARQPDRRNAPSGASSHRTAPGVFVREVMQFLMQAQRKSVSGASRGGGTD